MESSFTFLRVRGIEIGLNWTWLIVFALIAWSLSAGLFPRTYPGLDSTAYIVMGVITTVLFFASILLHELGHAFRALKEGMEIDGITLWLFGGVARFKSMFPSAGAEFRIAIAGPIVSVVIAGVFAALAVLGNATGWPEEVVGIVDYLARINAIVVAFNMVPALPLDGGRVLRSWLWHRQESFSAATVSAAKAGRAFGGMLIAVGVLGFITGAGLGGIWFVFLGWFLLQAASSEASYALLRTALRDTRVRDLMSPDPAVVRPDITIADFVDNISGARGHSTYPVVVGDQLQGMMSIRLAGKVSADERRQALVRDVMLPREEVPVVRPDADVFDALGKLQGPPGRAVVMDDGRVTGILSTSDIARALELAQVRGVEEHKRTRGAGIGVWIAVGAVMLLAAGFIYHPPVAVIEPGEAFDVADDISITGVEVDEVEGEYLLTSVQLGQPTGVGLAIAVIRGRQILPISAIIPEGQDPEEFVQQQRELFEESQRLAAAAGARAVGMQVGISGGGARVVQIAPNSPAAEKLEVGDVITAVNGDPVTVSADLQSAIRSQPAGTVFTLTVQRGGQMLEVDVRSRQFEAPEDVARIGVAIQTHDLQVDLPFEVSFRERDVGGPSAGLAYALAVADMLDGGDYAEGRSIATSGTIDFDGDVGPVGGVPAKVEAAKDAEADLLLVPVSEVSAARGEGLRVRGVRNLEEAISVLQS